MKYGTNDLILLLDTGASVSIIFKKYLDSNEIIDKTKKVRVIGISGSTITEGSANIRLQINNNKVVCHEFLLMNGFETGMHGVLGSDFFNKYAAKINYEKYNFSFWIENEKILLPMQSKYKFSTTIPARCEVIKFCWVDINDECVILPDELCEGVFVAGILATPNSNMVPVRILNVRDEEIELKNFRPKIGNLDNYYVYKFDENRISSVSRVDKLLELVKTDHLSTEENFSLQRVLAKYSDVFQLENDPVTTTNIYKQSINLKQSASPVYVKPYRLPQAQKQEVHQQIENMLKNGIIEKAKSPWSAPLLIVPKKVDQNGNKRSRLVIDYRLLNQKIEDDKFPLPCITEILDSLSGAIYFSHLDLSQGYYQIELETASRPCTAFSTERGQYQMTRLPMGLKISPSAFSRAMTIAMSGLNYDSCFVYLDDLIVFGNNLINHNKNLVKIFQRLRDVNLKLNPNKCEFLKKEILYLGNVISSQGVSPDPAKILAIQRYPTPKDADATKRFVAFANYYRRYIKNFAHIAAPLNNLSRKGVPFEWSTDCQLAFDTLKGMLINPPILQYPNFSTNNIFSLKTDASGFAIGAILSNDDDKPIAYASRTLNKSERNYCTIEKELLAIVWAVKHFRPYLYGRKFKIFTDHRPLIYLFGMANPSSRLTKFRLVLEEYDFTINYIKGKDNVTADALSRVEIDISELKHMGSSTINTLYAITRAQNKKMQADGLNSVLCDRLDHPGVVELLKPSKNSFELRSTTKSEFDKLINNRNHIYKIGNFICIRDIQTIYMKQDTRSTSALRASLRDLKDICIKSSIPELFIVKNKEGASLLKELLKVLNEFKKNNIKLTIIKNIQPITDLETRQIILNDFHILPTGGHAGVNRLYNNIKKYYFWTGLRNDVQNFVKKCDDCQRYKHSRPHIEPLTITTTASTALQKIFLDLVGPLEEDNEHNRYILTLQCELSKFVEGYPLPNKEAATVAKAFVENFILRYGIPDEIVTDRGTEFLASILTETCELLQIKKLNSTAYHHETLGALENTHKHLGAYLRIQSSKHPGTWSSWVPYWCFAFNNTVHSETKYTPHELLFGKLSKLPSNATISNCKDPLYNFDNYPLELKFRLQQACHDAYDNLIASKNKRKLMYDKKCNSVNYSIGDRVMLKNNSGNKNDPLYTGPYSIIENKSPNVVIKIDNKLVEVHKNRVKHYC